MSTSYPTFQLLREQHIESLNLDVQEFVHSKTGAQHIHIASDNPENVFLVALRTVPEDSTGVAHILEHTALCGSKKYPVRDPFFMMIRRSLNTFMNAFTSSDWTAYPFASQNRKDFDNLLDVYLDAVFFSRLDPLDFAQEGHRLEFEQTDNSDSNLVYKGVVYNEMKGAMSSASSILWHTLCKYVFPTSTYHHNSGGDPESIPDLSYEQLKAFYQVHYHPSNAIFMTFGDMSAAELQEKFEQQALSHFEALDTTIQVTDEKRYQAPIRVEEAYAYDSGDDSGSPPENKTHIVTGWLLGDSTDLQATLEAELLAEVLLENSASPLQHALETTELGNSPSPICGLEHSQKELLFVAGLEGSNTQNTEAVEQLILDAIGEVAEQGVSQERLEACLHQLELQQREITGDGYPYGLQLILMALNSATYRGDPIAVLDLDPVIKNLQQQIKNPDFIRQLARKLLLDNDHRVTLTLRPDTSLARKQNAAEQQKLKSIKQGLSETDKQHIIQQAHALAKRQQQKDDESILPKVTLEDIPKTLHIPEEKNDADCPAPLTYFPSGTNGLVYQQIVIPLPELNEKERLLLPVYTNILTELGVGKKDYLATQNWQSAVCGAINSFTSIRSKLDSTQQANGFFVLSSKGLHRNYAPLTELMQETLSAARFDEFNRINELIAQARARSEMAIPGNGHSFAMTAASSGISALGNYNHKTSGLDGIKSLKLLDEQLENKTVLAQFSEELQALHQKITQTNAQYLLISDEQSLTGFRKQLSGILSSSQTNNSQQTPEQLFSLPSCNEHTAQYWQCNVQVHYCAKAYPTVHSTHPDNPALTVLGGFLRNGFLHSAIREKGGAYGGGASHDSNVGAFRFYSYRDPRCKDTLSDFDHSIDWLLNNKHEWQQLEEAILGVISNIDKPSSPAGEAKSTFHNNLHGRTAEQRQAFRSAVLDVTLEDLQRVGSTYLKPELANTAVIGSQASADIAKQERLELIKL